MPRLCLVRVAGPRDGRERRDAMVMSQAEAKVVAWWLRRKIQEMPIEGELSRLVRRMVTALESGDDIEIQ